MPFLSVPKKKKKRSGRSKRVGPRYSSEPALPVDRMQKGDGDGRNGTLACRRTNHTNSRHHPSHHRSSSGSGGPARRPHARCGR